MLPDLIRLLEALALTSLVVLILPKRGWSSLALRFADLITGRRAWLFEPARRHSATLAADIRAELPRILEFGIPVFVAARLAERHASSCLDRERVAWQSSSSAVLLDLLQKRIDESEADRRLLALGLPQPRAKAQPAVRIPRPAMAADWFLAHAPEHAPETSTAHGNRPSQAEDPSVAESGKRGLEVRTLGALILRDGSEDLSPALLRSRVHSFLWLYLLIRAIANPQVRISRAQLADELTPGLGADKQRKRLRDRLSDLLSELPPPLRQPIKIEDDFVRFDLGECSVDVVRLFESARECAAREGLLSAALVAEIEAQLLDATEFLPEWDDVEREVTGARGAAADVVRDLRLKAEDARVTLLAALARDRMARRDAGKATPLLEQALERRPDREDLALTLRAAYLETGQVSRASALQREYSLDSQP